MSEKAVEVVQALLHELIEILNDKPALAKRLLEAIDYRLVDAAIDPLVLYRTEGREGLQKRLKELTAEQLRVVVKQHHIACQNVGKRKKAELIEVIAKHAANTD